jgi:hypothetical protein
LFSSANIFGFAEAYGAAGASVNEIFDAGLGLARGDAGSLSGSWAMSLFPLNRPRRLARDVIGHAIDPAHLIHNPRRDAIEEAHVKRINIRRHAIRAGHGT